MVMFTGLSEFPLYELLHLFSIILMNTLGYTHHNKDKKKQTWLKSIIKRKDVN